jgi:hypothetical protein
MVVVTESDGRYGEYPQEEYRTSGVTSTPYLNNFANSRNPAFAINTKEVFPGATALFSTGQKMTHKKSPENPGSSVFANNTCRST